MKYLYTFIGLQDACTHKLILYLQRKEESNRTEVHHEPNHCTVKKGGRERRRRLGERVRQNYNYNAVVQFFPSRQSALRFFPSLFVFDTETSLHGTVQMENPSLLLLQSGQWTRMSWERVCLSDTKQHFVSSCSAFHKFVPNLYQMYMSSTHTSGNLFSQLP